MASTISIRARLFAMQVCQLSLKLYQRPITRDVARPARAHTHAARGGAHRFDHLRMCQMAKYRASYNLLASYDYIVHTFASAEDFLRSTQQHDTSCVVANVQMPAMSGLDLLVLMRSRDYRAPFIFITLFPRRVFAPER
jgi:hypothetical protein